MDRMRYIYSVAVFLLAVTAAAFPAPPQLPSDPAVTYGTLPNGLTYYIVTNPSEKGMAEFALVRRKGADAGSHQLGQHQSEDQAQADADDGRREADDK